VGSTTLQFTAINSLINPPLAFDVTVNGVNTAIVTNNATVTAGFSGNITGLVNASASSLGAPILLGLATAGLDTALVQITLSSNGFFPGWRPAAALEGAADAARVNLTNVNDATAELDVTTGTNGYETLTANSIGIGPARLNLDTNATSTATLNATG